MDGVKLQLSHGADAVEAGERIQVPMMYGRLQLSHGGAAVESDLEAVLDAEAVLASIEPRPQRRGNRARPSSRRSAASCFNWATASTPWKQPDAAGPDHRVLSRRITLVGGLDVGGRKFKVMAG